MSGNVGDVTHPSGGMFDDVHQIAADFSAGDGGSKDLESIDLAFESGDQRAMNLARKLDLGLDAEVSVALAADKEDKQHVSERDGEDRTSAQHCHLLLQVSSALCRRMIDVAKHEK